MPFPEHKVHQKVVKLFTLGVFYTINNFDSNILWNLMFRKTSKLYAYYTSGIGKKEKQERLDGTNYFLIYNFPDFTRDRHFWEKSHYHRPHFYP